MLNNDNSKNKNTASMNSLRSKVLLKFYLIFVSERERERETQRDKLEQKIKATKHK